MSEDDDFEGQEDMSVGVDEDFYGLSLITTDDPLVSLRLIHTSWDRFELWLDSPRKLLGKGASPAEAARMVADELMGVSPSSGPSWRSSRAKAAALLGLSHREASEWNWLDRYFQDDSLIDQPGFHAWYYADTPSFVVTMELGDSMYDPVVRVADLSHVLAWAETGADFFDCLDESGWRASGRIWAMDGHDDDPPTSLRSWDMWSITVEPRDWGAVLRHVAVSRAQARARAADLDTAQQYLGRSCLDRLSAREVVDALAAGYHQERCMGMPPMALDDNDEAELEEDARKEASNEVVRLMSLDD